MAMLRLYGQAVLRRLSGSLLWVTLLGLCLRFGSPFLLSQFGSPFLGALKWVTLYLLTTYKRVTLFFLLRFVAGVLK